MNYTRINTTYHEEIDPMGCFDQGMGAAAPAINTNKMNRLRENDYKASFPVAC